MPGRRDADDSGSRRFLTAADRLRELARIAGDLGADDIVHDAVAFIERPNAADMMDAAVAKFKDRLIFEIDERRAALMRPSALSGSHASELRAAIGNAQQWLRDASHESAADQEAVVARFKEERDRFLATADAAAATLRDSVQQVTAGRWELWPRAVARANEIAFGRLRDWIAAMQPATASMHLEAVGRYAAALEKLLDRMRAAGVDIEGDVAVENLWKPPALEFVSVAVDPPLRWHSLFRAITGSTDRAAISDEAAQILRQAMGNGSEKMVDALRDALVLARRRMEWEIALQLRATADSLKRAADAAHEAQAGGAQGIADELNRLDELARRLSKVR